MLRKYFARTIGFIVVITCVIWAKGDMSLTLDDGREVILHADSTWGFAKFTLSEGDESDIYITLNDNRIIWLKTDNSWTFTKTQPKVNKPIEYPSVSTVGTATRQTLDQAVSAATTDALNKAAASLRRFAPARIKNAQALIAACIKNEIGENGAEVSYNPGWKAEAKVSLTPPQVKKVMACFDDQIAPAAESK